MASLCGLTTSVVENGNQSEGRKMFFCLRILFVAIVVHELNGRLADHRHCGAKPFGGERPFCCCQTASAKAHTTETAFNGGR
jgi:hypothetical protein